MNEKIKKAFYDFVKSLIPLLATFAGVVLADKFGVDTKATAVASGTVGSLIFDALC